MINVHLGNTLPFYTAPTAVSPGDQEGEHAWQECLWVLLSCSPECPFRLGHISIPDPSQSAQNPPGRQSLYRKSLADQKGAEESRQSFLLRHIPGPTALQGVRSVHGGPDSSFVTFGWCKWRVEMAVPFSGEGGLAGASVWSS